jgi:carbonic anhydrase
VRQLIEGIHRFQSGVFGSQKELFARLAKGQEPDALFITCSDSRINPNLITQTRPGDLFILRNAGNIVPAWGVPSGEAATIEYAIEALGIKDIIVCGHSHCGAMGAVVNRDAVKELPAVDAWLDHCEGTRRILRHSYQDVKGDELVEVAIEENVLVQIENLRTHPSVMSALARGALTLHAWVYELESGGVLAFSEKTGQYVPLAEAGTSSAEERGRLGGRRKI